MKPFRCLICEHRANQSVDWLTYALRDPGCLAVNNTIFPVCQAASCARKAQISLDAYRSNPSFNQGVVKLGPEILSCRTCFKDYSDKVPLQACSRCSATLYCSRECQKLGLKWHKQQCTGCVEAAKLTIKQLAQLDTFLRIKSGGTMELPEHNHPGKLPQAQVEAGIGDLLDCGTDTAIARIAKNAKLAKKEKKAKAELMAAPVPLTVTHQQKLELEGVRSDIFKYFGLLSQTKEVVVPNPASA